MADAGRGIKAGIMAMVEAATNPAEFDPHSRDVVREMRVEACRRAARLLRADIESPGADE